jgi:hypothetical protein
VECAIGNLRKDIRGMRAAEDPEWWLLCVVAWRTVGTIVPITGDGIKRVASKAFVLLGLARYMGRL